MPQTPEDSERLKVTQLPPITEGIAIEVFTEILTDKEAFIREEMARLGTENRPLRNALVQTTIISPHRDKSLDWALSYYAIISRSANGSGLPMLYVTEAIIEEAAKEISTTIPAFQRRNDIEGVKRYFERQEARRSRLTDEESIHSPELATYWGVFSLTLARQTMVLAEGSPVHMISDAISDAAYFTRDLMHRQLERNQATQPKKG